jgi:UDP-N-acetylmuramoyl-L-alanyl-D-glutamate--2,6-diaminopimelate ligase
MKPTLEELVRGLGARIVGPAHTPIADLCYDSRRAAPGALFVALRGARTDGHRYLRQAIDGGAAALLVEQVTEAPSGVPTAVLHDTRAALPEVAARFFRHPGREMTLIGVTGTNGKTSAVRLLESVLLAAGRTAGSIGTISTRGPGFEEPSGLTTPESVDLQRSLARLRDSGCEAVALEVSSHGLALGRVRTLRFAAAVFTHLTLDHLDFHRDMDDYAAAKAELFGPQYLAGTAVLNARDPLTPRLIERARSAGRPALTFARGAESGAHVRTTAERLSLEGAWLRVASDDAEIELELPLPGDFQIENALAAITAARALGIDWEAIRTGVSSCPPVPGRLERVAATRPIVLVDYAHTPDALDSVLARVRPLVAGHLISVFGCGGDRDKSKRAPMARAACAHSDWVIATSDNPRSEDPEAILRDVAQGLSGPHEVVADRREAIRRAIERAADDDVVVIAGQGHEVWQQRGGERIPFDDRVEARRALAQRGSAP